MRFGMPPAAGQLLIATEPGKETYFDRSVVLLLEHSDEGSLGVCLHQLADVDMVPALEHLEPFLTPPAGLFEGGPVSQQSAVCLTRLANPGEDPVGWKRIFEDVGVLDLETPVELVQGAYSDMRIFVGLSGWDSKQLEGELIRGFWFRTQARVEEVFGPPQDLWRRVLRRVGGPDGRWSTWTETPQFN